MKKKTKLIVSITGITIVLLALLGITYAYYLTRIQGNTNTNSISVTTAKLELVYGDNSAEIITGTGALTPSTDLTSTGAIGTKEFTVTNNGNDSSYVVIIDNVSITKASDNTDTKFETNDFRYTLTCKKSDNSDCNNVTDLTVFPVNGGILVSNDIKASDVHTYVLTLWYIDTGIDQSADMGKTYQARVNITDVNQMENPFMTGVSATDNANLAYNIINNAKENKNGTTFVNTPLTKIAEEISSSNLEKGNEQNISISMDNIGAYASTADDAYNCYEMGDCNNDAVSSAPSSCSDIINKYVFDSNMYESYYVDGCDGETPYYTISAETTISTTLDDYGTSYYFRGNVEDNYVNFAGMCWRIVRIAGDGTTKLILEDQYTTCDDTETETTSAVYTGNWNIGKGNYGYDSSSKSTSGSILYKMNYLNPVTNNTLSMVKAFYDFQTTKLADYTGKLKSGDWCLGDKAYTRSGSSGSYTYTLLEDTSSNYLSKTSFYYDAYTRLNSGNANGYQPTLKCNGTILNEFADVSGVSSKAPMYVSAITADEIVYAGGKYGAVNGNYYLLNNYQKSNIYYFWSLSPNLFNGSNAYAFYVSHRGILFYNVVYGSNAFRPSVSLASSAVITGGEGTLESPYIIG